MKKDWEKWTGMLELGILLLGCAVLLSGVWASARQRELSDKVVRLHVLAVSDESRDQEVKQKVRDAVLERVEPLLADAADAREAQARLASQLDELRQLAETVSGERAQVTLSREAYPTRNYRDFSLPAGTYTSLRVVLGEGKGRNWWCVVYPPLCTAGVEEAAQTAALSRDDVKLISESDTGYQVRFRLLEWWGELLSDFK